MTDALLQDVRLHIFQQVAEAAVVPQPPAIAAALGRSEADVRAALQQLATNKVIVLTPTTGNIWIAPPFCAVPSAFRVEAKGRKYWGVCIWDALGILAALGADGLVRTSCADCGDLLSLEIRGGKLLRAQGIVHFAVPARRWWDNIGFT